jgi:hypothetical protein
MRPSHKTSNLSDTEILIADVLRPHVEAERHVAMNWVDRASAADLAKEFAAKLELERGTYRRQFLDACGVRNLP